MRRTFGLQARTLAIGRLRGAAFAAGIGTRASGAKFSSAKDDDVVTTPRNPSVLFNFGPASSRDTILFTSERPGAELEKSESKTTAKDMQDWIGFMRNNSVMRILVLLDENELESYEDPGLLKMYEEQGFKFHFVPMGESGACTRAFQFIDEAHDKNERVIAHCTHGMGRSGRVAAGWLVHKYGLSPEMATSEAMEVAIANGIERLGSPSKLKKWLENL